jgi:protoporphyrinogen/coproporphyrinogen III oxidase
MSHGHRVVVIGGGIAGLTTALSIISDSPTAVQVTVLEAKDTVGGIIRTTPFAGLPAIDEGADAFLVRVPHAQQLATQLGLGDSLTAPTGAHASVWHNGMHDIPSELVLGIPAKARAFTRSTLFSPYGKVRAAVEPLLPRTTDNDSIGHYVRRRFGREVHERLVDPLVGSIYGANTDSFSMEAVPQLSALTTERSMLRAAGRARTAAAKNAQPGAPIFGAPIQGMGALIGTLAQRATSLGANIVLNARVHSVTKSGHHYIAHTDGHDYEADAIVVASPARHSAPFIRDLDSHAGQLLSEWTHASVVLITLAIPATQWPARFTGSGYLVPKPDQRWVTAASFGSNKWAHWRPTDGSMILRVSLGRDGLDVMHFDDDKLVNLALADLKLHLGVDLQPTDIRISRWAESFPQYRPHHFARLAEIEKSLGERAPGVMFAGASYRGIGIPACVQQARAASTTTHNYLSTM